MIPSAEYLRMSTEHQKYSLQNQSAAIARFAAAHGFVIAKTYVDPAKSGLDLRGRTGLRALLKDVLSGNVSYKVVLIYDVSRWGRFQDDDEAACYEFLCRNSGVSVIYCAEPFRNDGSVASSILKTLSRIDARELSREMSMKAIRSKSIIVQRGFWAGGPAPYGYQRRLISSDSRRNQILMPGQRKSLSIDHVILTPGSRSEIELVRRMFALASSGQVGVSQIAQELNRQGFTNRGNLWLPNSVEKILTNPVYAGANVWGRASQKLRRRPVRVTAEKWICNSNAFTPIIKPAYFQRIQRALQQHRIESRWTDEKILLKLRDALRKNGKLSGELFNQKNDLPSFNTLARRFGSVLEAYRRIGYQAPRGMQARVAALRVFRRLQRDLTNRIVSLFPNQVTASRLAFRPLLRFSNAAEVSVLVARSISRKVGRWWELNRGDSARPVLLCLADSAMRDFEHFYLLPRWNLSKLHRFTKDDPLLLPECTLHDLSQLSSALQGFQGELGSDSFGPKVKGR